MSFIHDRFSELQGDKDAIVKATLSRFEDDVDWRTNSFFSRNSNFVRGSTAFDEAVNLFEATSENPGSDLPRINLIRRAVEDFLAVTLENIPTARLFPDRVVPQYLPQWQKDMRLDIVEEAAHVMNAYVKTIMNVEQYQDKIQRAVWMSGIFGVGYVQVGLDTSADIRESFELRNLMAQDELSPDEARRIDILTKRIQLQVPDPRDVYWESGKRRVDADMLRVSIISRESTRVLQKELADKVDNPENIRPGKFPHSVGETRIGGLSSGVSISNNEQTAIMDMWELEPVEKVRTIPDPETGVDLEMPFTDWFLHHIQIAGGEFVFHKMFTGILSDDDKNMEEGTLQLPVVPVYLRQSVDHPYGFSIPLMLKKSEEFINVMRTIMYKGARKAVVTQGVVVAMPNLGRDDLDELETVLEEGGIARIFGNSQSPLDIKDTVMPLSFANAPINTALIQAIDSEMGAFRLQAQAVDPSELRSARSGSAKRAQIAAADRPKSISIQMLSEGIETIMELIYKNVRVFHNTEVGVMIDSPAGEGRDYVTLNERFERTIIDQDESAVTPQNPLGFVITTFEATLNATNLNMFAKSSGRSDLPLDMISRFQLLIGLQQAGILDPITVQELTLDDNIRERDEQNRRRRQEVMLQQQQALAPSMMPLLNARDNTAVQRMIGGGSPLPGPTEMQPNRQDIASDLLNQGPISSPSAAMFA